MATSLEALLATVLQLPATRIADDLAMKDVDAWDSLKHMELIVSVENTYGIELSFDEIVAMQTVREIKRVLRHRGVTS
ncbi:MAG TPA: acyl carrier protein [Pyrinomonadaceae bacterium]|nr:acyl carrier protein [Pyrinomonadaceae bacterium]